VRPWDWTNGLPSLWYGGRVGVTTANQLNLDSLDRKPCATGGLSRSSRGRISEAARQSQKMRRVCRTEACKILSRAAIWSILPCPFPAEAVPRPAAPTSRLPYNGRWRAGLSSQIRRARSKKISTSLVHRSGPQPEAKGREAQGRESISEKTAVELTGTAPMLGRCLSLLHFSGRGRPEDGQRTSGTHHPAG
jgi:hypothetical protein